MLKHKKLIIYPTFESQPPSIPERSAFYPLQPIGVGTYKSESLVSYLARLASLHCVSPQTLLEEITRKKDYAIHPIIRRERWALSDLIRKLETRTRQSALHRLTMLSWSSVINPLRLYKSVLSWCPLCYQEWKQQNLPLYLPIIWLIGLVKVCPVHNYPLVQNCCQCGSSLRISVKPFNIGYCPKCQAWLGDSDLFSAQISQSQHLSSIYEYYPLTQSYIIENVRDLITLNSLSKFYLFRGRVAHNFRFFLAENGVSFVGKVPDFVLKQFARESFLNFTTLNNCIHHGYIPRLITLLRITYRLKLSVRDFLFPKSP